MTGPRRRSWEAPAEWPSDECDCFWHRRIFSHVARSITGRGAPDNNYLPLARLVTRYDYTNGDLMWEAEMRVESTLLVARRSMAHNGDGTMTPPVFGAWAEIGGAPAVELQRFNPQFVGQYGPGGSGDPTLIYELPNRAGRLVVWSQAWWWRLIDGVDPLHYADH